MGKQSGTIIWILDQFGELIHLPGAISVEIFGDHLAVRSQYAVHAIHAAYRICTPEHLLTGQNSKNGLRRGNSSLDLKKK